MASMKMFQIQFHTGFVPRNATTVTFAKSVHNFEKCSIFHKQNCRHSKLQFFLHHFLFPAICSPLRYDLDACDIQEKYPDLFQVNLNIEVDSRDKPSTKTPPWESFQSKGLNPKILFSSRDEQQEILSKFGG